ncbi:MAG: hypothetical protein ALECFALPRED_008750 [Alectoria fallacina]|uniref:Protein kinase domain-containing protein n=1 Tax=Alectoria fallacina TaxID=1903189 RepID=A0A8H3EX85_9LECA|nr:MAG: hypothetical protein ALECFALPRED_008750 [Alectoria fallacina]
MDIETVTYSTVFPVRSRRKSSLVAGATLHSAIYPTSATILQDSLISFLSYIKTQNIPILPVTKPDIRSVLGQGASFMVNGAEVPETYVDPVSGTVFPQGMTVAFKRAILNRAVMKDPIAGRIHVILNELLTMHHPPLRAHPNIVKLLGVGFETEGPSDDQRAMPVLIPECAELGNLAEVLETARKEDRPLEFEEKLSLCLDIAHGLEILHACDIVHGDVKCENVLIFEERDDSKGSNSEHLKLVGKLTDFGVLRLEDGGLILGGSRPWQAPEFSRTAYFKIEEAKRTDVYSFGMLLWRVFLDGDPFKSLGDIEGKTPKEKRQSRNDAIAALKEEDRLVQHVCVSLALSENFTRPQLEMLCEVIGITLIKDASRRELDMARIIRLLAPNNWYEARHPVPPKRLPLEVDANLLDMEKWHSEFERVSPVVQNLMALGFQDCARGPSENSEMDLEEEESAAAYQVAICYANGFGVHFEPGECLKWLRVAANGGSQKAQEALPKVAQAFQAQSTAQLTVFTDPWAKSDDACSLLSSSWASEFADVATPATEVNGIVSLRLTDGTAVPGATWTLLNAAERCRYDVLESLLVNSAKPGTSDDGVSPIHFLSSWDISKAEGLGRRLIVAGAEVNVRAKRGPTVGGTPLMWSVYGDHVEHSQILLKLGADPMAATVDGDDALSFAAKLHLTAHLRLLLENVRPSQVRGHLRRLIAAAAGGESRFTRISRHGRRWTKAATETLQLLRDWNALFPDAEDFRSLVLPALESGLKTSYGRTNSDVQVDFIKSTGIEPVYMHNLLRESVLSFNKELFDALLDYGVPVSTLFERKKSLLHLCAKIPDHSVAATEFAPRLLNLGAEIDATDEDGLSPWMDTILERKWDLADLLMKRGADALATDKAGFNVLGLCISSLNLGAIKYLMKYCEQKQKFQEDSFLINKEKQISALQLASTLTLPRAHGMKLEVVGVFLTILTNFAMESWQLNFRSDGLLPNASALDIAASKGNVHAVKNLVKKGAHLAGGSRAAGWAQAKLSTTTEYMQRKNLERCTFIIENWDDKQKHTRRLADDWTNMRTIDESHVASSWDILVFDYAKRDNIKKAPSAAED